MASRSVRKVRHYSPTTFTFGERVRAGQEKLGLTELWHMTVPRYQPAVIEEDVEDLANGTHLFDVLEALRPEGGYQTRPQRRKGLTQKEVA